MIKLIVSDLDGTLLKYDDTIETKTLSLLKQKMDQGVEFIMATGRDYNMVIDVMKGNDLYCDMILNNGTQFRSLDGSIDEMFYMDDTSLKQIISILQQYDYHISIHTNKGKYGLVDKEIYFSKHVELLLKHAAVSSMDQIPKKTFTTREGYLRNYHFIESIDDMLDQGVRALKIDARHLHPETVTGIHEVMKTVENLDISSSFEDNIEITSNAFNKGTMLEKIMKQKGLKPEEVAVFGDGLNDAAMLEICPYSFVPSNASKHAKKVANHILTKTAEQGAVKEGIELLEKKHLI